MGGKSQDIIFQWIQRELGLKRHRLVSEYCLLKVSFSPNTRQNLRHKICLPTLRKLCSIFGTAYSKTRCPNARMTNIKISPTCRNHYTTLVFPASSLITSPFPRCTLPFDKVLIHHWPKPQNARSPGRFWDQHPHNRIAKLGWEVTGYLWDPILLGASTGGSYEREIGRVSNHHAVDDSAKVPDFCCWGPGTEFFDDFLTVELE